MGLNRNAIRTVVYYSDTAVPVIIVFMSSIANCDTGILKTYES